MTDDLLSLIAGIAALAYLAFWVWALIDAGNSGKWGWFIAVFFLSPVLLIVYVLLGRRRRRVADLNDT